MKLFFKVIPTTFRNDDMTTTAATAENFAKWRKGSYTEPTGKDGEYVTAVKIMVGWGVRVPPPDSVGTNWRRVATFCRYKRGGEWFLGCEAWHPRVPTMYTIYRDDVDKTDLTDCVDAFKLAYRLTEDQRAETGDYLLYHKTKQRIAAYFGEEVA